MNVHDCNKAYNDVSPGVADYSSSLPSSVLITHPPQVSMQTNAMYEPDNSFDLAV